MQVTRRNTLSTSVEIGLRLIGVWPNSLYPFLYRLLWIVSMLVIQASQLWYIVENFKSQAYVNMMDSVTLFFEYCLMVVKLILLWLNRCSLHDILASMAKDWEECYNDFHVRTMSDKAILSKRFSDIFIGFYAISCVIYDVENIMYKGIYKNMDSSVNGTNNRDLPVMMKFPFETNVTPIFEIILLLTIIHDIASTLIFAVLISLIMTLVFHMGGQIDAICHDLIETSLHKDKQNPFEIKVLINRHQRIIDFSDQIENVFTYIMLVQMLWNTVVISCIGYMLVISINSEDGLQMLIKFLVFYFGIMLEVFLFCFAGEYVSDKSKMIGDAAYQSLWYNMSSENARILLILIVRSQKQLTITAGKIMNLSLECFTNIMKATVSYTSVLRAMY